MASWMSSVGRSVGERSSSCFCKHMLYSCYDNPSCEEGVKWFLEASTRGRWTTWKYIQMYSNYCSTNTATTAANNKTDSNIVVIIKHVGLCPSYFKYAVVSGEELSRLVIYLLIYYYSFVAVPHYNSLIH